MNKVNVVDDFEMKLMLLIILIVGMEEDVGLKRLVGSVLKTVPYHPHVQGVE